MADVLLTNTYFLQFDPKQERLMQPYPPLATLYAASVIRTLHYSIDFFDTVFAPYERAVFPLIEKNAGGIFFICDDGFNYLTKMCLVNMRDACFEMIRFAKKNNCTVVVSSSDATDHWTAYLEEGADFIIIGEAEQTIRELIPAIKNNLPVAGIKGVAYIADGEKTKTPAREVAHELDAIPFPAWDLIDMENYRRHWVEKNGYFSLNMTTTRGCPFKCNWCAKPIYGNRYNSRSPENVVDEMEILIQQYQVEHFWFCDDIFGLKPGWVKRFSELITQKNISIRFKIQCRADLLLDENNIEHLAKAGCEEVWIGAESGSQKILDAMDKGTTIEQIKTATRLMKLHQIKPCFFLQFGYIGETKEDIHQTIDLLLELMPYDIGISVSYPLPGTKFFERVKNDLTQKQNWNDSDELLMMFRSTYSPSYYKQLHRFVHKRYRMAQGFLGWKKLFTAPKSIHRTELKRAIGLPYFMLYSSINYLRLRAIGK